jgi:hypothetical protein
MVQVPVSHVYPPEACMMGTKQRCNSYRTGLDDFRKSPLCQDDCGIAGGPLARCRAAQKKAAPVRGAASAEPSACHLITTIRPYVSEPSELSQRNM